MWPTTVAKDTDYLLGSNADSHAASANANWQTDDVVSTIRSRSLPSLMSDVQTS